MKNTLKNIALLFCLTLGAAISTNAQAVTSGAVDFSVAVPEAFSFRSNGAPTTNDSQGIAANSTNVNGALSAAITVLDASPNANNANLTANVPFRIRSNRNYQLTAKRDGISTADPQAFDSSDIKMGIRFNQRSGANVNLPGTTPDTPASGWAVIENNNVATLTASATQIATGPRISNQGNNTASSPNFTTGDLVFSIKRQYYTPTAAGSEFTENIQVSISAP